MSDIAGLVKGASEGAGLGNKFLSHVRQVDALVFSRSWHFCACLVCFLSLLTPGIQKHALFYKAPSFFPDKSHS